VTPGVISGPNHETPMVWHDAIGQETHRHSRQRLHENILEGLVVVWVEEQLMASDSPIVNVNYQVVSPSQGAAGHCEYPRSNCGAR
jgi:hypothetical protein